MNKKRYIVNTIVADLLIFAVLLLTFSWFHHVKRLWAEDDAIDYTDMETNDDVIVDKNDGGDKDEPSPDGDFGATLPDVFADEGVVDKGDGYYRSHDIYLTVTEVVEPRDEYIAKYFIYDVYVRNLENIFTVATSTRTAFTTLVEHASPIAAVSGDFWGNNAELAVRNGKVLTQKSYLENDICVMYGDGTMEIVSPYEYTGAYFVGKDVYQIWDFGPSLLDDDGKAYESFPEYSDINPRNPRCSIGYYEPGHYVFIVVEGRITLDYEGEDTYFKGMRLPDLAKVYEELGVTAAYNLDGGDSAFAYYDGEILRQDYERAVNSDEEPRKIYDIICIDELEG